MSIESRLKRGDNPDDVAKLFGLDAKECRELQRQLTKKPKKKAEGKA